MYPPGWYPDERNAGLERYWNGHHWTHETRVRYERYQPHTGPVRPEPPARAGRSGLPRWQTWWVIVPGLLLCFPLGLIGLWLRPGVANRTRWGLTGATAVLLTAVAVSPTSEPTGQRVQDDTAAATAPATSAAPVPSPTPTAEPTPTEPPSAAVPALAGQTRDDAVAALTAVGLVVGTVTTRASRQAAGTVLSQGTEAGAAAAPGTPVDLVVAEPLPVVPDVVGLGRRQAVTTLEAAGFTVAVTVRETRSGKDNVVLEQSPAGSRSARPGARIKLVVSDVQVAPLVQSNCTPGYTPCLPPASDYDCAGGSGNGPAYAQGPVYVTGSDPYDLDRDGDGVACE